jgi:hypothetical protein
MTQTTGLASAASRGTGILMKGLGNAIGFVPRELMPQGLRAIHGDDECVREMDSSPRLCNTYITPFSQPAFWKCCLISLFRLSKNY